MHALLANILIYNLIMRIRANILTLGTRTVALRHH